MRSKSVLLETIMLGEHPVWRQIGIGLLAVAIAIAIRRLADGALGPYLPFITLYPALLSSAIFGGPAAGWTALLASIAYFLWMALTGEGPTLADSVPAALLRNSMYLGGGGLIILSSGYMRSIAKESRATQARLFAALTAARVGTWRWDVASDVVEWDAALRDLYGLSSASPRTACEFMALVHPDDRAHVEAIMQAGLSRGGGSEVEFRILCPDGSIRWIYNRNHASRERAGAPLIVTGANLDITQRKLAEAENAHLAAVVAASRDAIVSFDEDGLVRSWNAGAESLFGVTRAQTLGKRADALDFLPEALADAVLRGLRGESASFEGQGADRTGAPVHASVSTTPILNANGERLGVSCIIRDDGARNAVMEAKSLLVHELHHRVRNTLGTVQALISSTARTADNVVQLRDSLAVRLRSLARTHDLVTSGADQRATVRDLLWLELEPYADPSDRVSLEGPAFDLISGQALNFAMAVHELATNAAKHGALSSPNGRVDVRWRVEDSAEGRALRVDWCEAGGPCPAPPLLADGGGQASGDMPKKGFGMSLLRRLFPCNLIVDYHPDGVRIAMQMDLFDMTDIATLPPARAQVA